MDGTTILILLGVGVFMAILIAISLRAHNKMVANGEIISRDTKFMEKAELFTLNAPEPTAVSGRIKGFSVYEKGGISMKGSTEDQKYVFKASSWSAVLERQSVSDGKSVYRFQFVSWKTSNGMAQDSLNMNRLLTAIEKMFLEFDPQTQVGTELVDFKTKHKLF